MKEVPERVLRWLLDHSTVPALPLPLAVPRPPALLVPAIPAHPDFFSRTVRASVSTKHEFDDKRVKIGVLCVGEQVRALV